MISFALVERQSQLCLFEFLYRTYSQGMFQIAYGILHDVQHAEDMVAETYIRVAKNINRIAEIPADKHRSYLKMIIRNICIDYYRSIHPTDTVYEIPLDLSDNSSGPEDIIIDRITVEEIVQAISELPDKYRDVLKLSYLYDHTTEEIGIALNLSTSNTHYAAVDTKHWAVDRGYSYRIYVELNAYHGSTLLETGSSASEFRYYG